jgi:hypothetical protein
MKRMLIAISALFTVMLVCPKPAEAARVIVTVGPGYYAPGYYWDPAGTDITLTPTGAAVIGSITDGTIIGKTLCA